MKIFRVYAHDRADATKSSFFITANSVEEFISKIINNPDREIEIDEIVEYTVDAVVNLLNLYVE